jgi:non-ribosomal peptide synthetase component F
LEYIFLADKKSSFLFAMFKSLFGSSPNKSTSDTNNYNNDTMESGTLVSLFEQHVMKYGEKLALVTEDGAELTYAQLDAKANDLRDMILSIVGRDSQAHLVGQSVSQCMTETYFALSYPPLRVNIKLYTIIRSFIHLSITHLHVL